MLISIVICTYNRCESLKDTLGSVLTQQQDGSFDYEVIVVDNNSMDNTKEVIESYKEKFDGRLNNALENNQGLSYARNRGIKESKGEIIVFTDDDIIADKNWLINIVKCFKDYNCDAVGGRSLPLFASDVPQWIIDNQELIRGVIGKHDYGDVVMEYQKGKIRPMIGANMSIKRCCFDEIGFFRTDIGQGTGSKGEESEFFGRLKTKGKKIYHSSKALVWHKVPRERANFKYVTKWNIQLGRYYARKKKDGKLICYCGIPRFLIKSIFIDLVKFPFGVFSFRRFLKSWIILSWEIGYALEIRAIHKCIK
jgi:glycosyltransferase involved in cell wall biosynthesis